MSLTVEGTTEKVLCILLLSTPIHNKKRMFNELKFNFCTLQNIKTIKKYLKQLKNI